MNSSKWIWRYVSVISMLATIVLFIGFIYAVKDINWPKASVEVVPSSQELGEGVEESMADKQEYKISGLGDSLAKGTGDDTGSGFVKRSVEMLSKRTGKTASLLNNLGINGLTTSGLVTRLDEAGVQYVLKQSDIIILSIGANDLFRGAKLLSADESTQEITAERLRNVLPPASEQLQIALDKLREINPKAYIIYVGLYNPFGDLQEISSVGNEVVTTWNNIVLTTMNRDERMTLVPTYDIFVNNLDRYLTSDHFHPNADGYQQIAERIVQGIQ
ncbi:GDSL-type esterase/lipase family protein [Paenibacillus crassostreae]|uniref:SGNH hydrolase-type esterase domain-containing protein n=1 Tax=Paenibacillus crassostreae TaxID=1763538 RepID=A0A167DMY8_9BACL|nr:GDSL-type esterase/lipase family protein [Paenibacillus crassostreae]AOZ91264.1 hypothetical protein LPB68_02960 [Paenibacillus crassostreae]OAB74576.1 hypothetical protein PNBC_11000 [Paenibacillus crassostreae]